MNFIHLLLTALALLLVKVEAWPALSKFDNTDMVLLKRASEKLQGNDSKIDVRYNFH